MASTTWQKGLKSAPLCRLESKLTPDGKTIWASKSTYEFYGVDSLVVDWRELAPEAEHAKIAATIGRMLHFRTPIIGVHNNYNYSGKIVPVKWIHTPILSGNKIIGIHAVGNPQ